ncbi:MAG: M48 family metalloprotease, partial [Anaerohalosphaera sp.]|nr:M48 family metalloprotease [Anaerohalosphaera sp.]
MESLQYILQSPIIQKLGWTLVHFVWQAAAIAAILAIVLKILQKHSSNLRYTIACLALVLVVPIQVITLRNIEVAVPAFDPVKLASHDLPQSPALVVTEMLPLGSSPLPPQNVVMPTVPLKDRLIGAVEPALPYVVVIWLVGVFSLSLWHLGGWTQLQKLRRQMVKDVTPTIRSKSQHLAGLMGIRKAISLMESALVQVPTVIGHFKPIILLPATALTGLSSEQIEAILAHELAHIKRNDYFFNILLTVVEILGFYHPAVWWISHKIRVERENCCDDLAIDMVQNRKEYASALFTMEQIRAKQPNLALSANGGHLFERIRRLLAKDSSHARFNGWAVASAIVLVMIALAIPVAFAISGEDAASFDSDNDANITAAELVRHVRASENWIHNVDTLYLRINRTFSALTGDALAQAQKRYETEMKQRRAGMIPSPPSTTDTSDMVEIALGDNRLRYLTKRDTSTQIKIWDGKQVSTYGEYADFDQKHYALRDELQESFQHLMQDMNWLRCQPHVFWWKNRTLPMDYYGSPDEFEIIGEENYRGTDCYVLEYLPEGDAQKAGLSWKWYVGKKDRLLRAITSFRNGKPAIQHWTLNYKQVAPGCVMPMTQGHHFYKWNEDGTSYYIAGPINLKLTEVRVNQKLDDSLFEMEFTDGITVQDDRQGVFISYPYDSKVANMSMPQRARAASKLRLKNIGKGLYDYALDYDDNYPPTLDWLAERNYIETWHIIGKGPKPKRFAGPDYIYITGLSGWSSPNNIIVYENTEYLRRNTDKVNIISCDGHIESVTPDELIRQLQATYKRLGKDVSKIDKLRWADTVNDPDPKQPLQQSGANTAILLPDIRKVLNLSTGRIIDVPFSNKMPDEWLKYVQQNVNCGIIFDHDGELSHLGFINISSVSRPTTKKNGIEMMSFVSKNLPQQITVTAKDNKQYTVKILNAKNQGCTLQYKQIADAKDQAADTSGDTSKSKSIEHVNMLRSATNMKYIGRALHVYAFDYDDKFPPALNELVPTTDIHPKTFKSPRQPHGFDGPGYIYISGQTANDSPNNVIVYENTKCLPKATGKVNVLFRDGHIQAVKPDELIEFLRETYKNLGKNVSDIEKLIWADTVDARFGGTGGFGGMARPDDDMNMGIKFANSKPNQIVAAENLYSFSDAMQTAEIVGQMLNGAWKSMAELKISYKKKDWGAVEENSIQVRDVFRR